MRSNIDSDFLMTYGRAFQNFFRGDWDTAYPVFRSLADDRSDGVSLYYCNLISRWRERVGTTPSIDEDSTTDSLYSSARMEEASGTCPKKFNGFNIEGHDW